MVVTPPQTKKKIGKPKPICYAGSTISLTHLFVVGYATPDVFKYAEYKGLPANSAAALSSYLTKLSTILLPMVFTEETGKLKPVFLNLCFILHKKHWFLPLLILFLI